MDKKELITIETKENNENLDEIMENNKQKMAELIIQKWLVLQKTIKEEITLEEIITKHQKNEFAQLKDYFKNYYSKKLESRKVLEEIKGLDKEDSRITKDLVIEKDLKDTILDVCQPITNLLFTFRDNYDYIIALISLISENDQEEKISSLVELFCNQFYENILIPNPEQEELLLLIYRLLEIEISPMNCASTDYFLNEDTFLGKFMSSFMKRQELKVFLSSLVNPLILKVENESADNCLNMSLYDIKDFVKEKKMNDDNIQDINLEEIEDLLLKNIPKTSIIFNKYKKENEQKEKQYINVEMEEDEEEEEESNDENDEEIVENWKKNLSYKNLDSINRELEYNNDYEKMIDFDFLENQINNEKDEELKNLYLYELDQITEEDSFSNKGIIEVLKENEFRIYRKYIIEKYKTNFIFIKNKIDFLIQSLIDKIESIPYTVRCICKVIFLLIKKKFPLLNNYLRNSFIGKFIFNKCIFPLLNLENKNILEPRILSANTKKCLYNIISVLDKANQCQLFNYYIDTEKTIFNHYIIEIIPILNKFYEKLLDIELPPVLKYLVSKTQLNDEIYIFNKNDNLKFINNNENNVSTLNEKGSVYNYFHEHNDELLHLQCICFSFEDILFILKLISRNTQAFSGLPGYTSFIKTYEYIQQSEYKLDDIINKNKKKTEFFLVFKAEKNSRFEKLINQNKSSISTFSSDIRDSDLISKRFKFCIKTILKGLNLLNNKDYSYLNMAFTTGKFFSALKHTLDDFGELSEVKNKIPLKWYGQFIFNNKDVISQKYKNDDYSKLYEEIYNEESNVLNDLKSITSTIITRDGMNIRCAEKILQNENYDNFHINQVKEFVKIDKFIEKEKIEVCFQINDIKENEINIKEKEKEKEKEKNRKIRTKKDKTKIPLYITEDPNCPHKSGKHPESEGTEAEIIQYHAYSIKDFINKFSEKGWGEEKLYNHIKPITLIKEDIKNGSRDNQIYTSFNQYMSIVKKHIKKNKKIFHIQSEYDCSTIAAKIEDYIMRQLYIHVYPKEELDSDINFYNQTKKLYWIMPEHLDIKKIYINQLSNAVVWIKKIDEAKSIRDKLSCISNAYNTMNNTIKFSSGKNENAGQDELTPIFQYIIIKAQPRRIFSNINYIKCFLDDSGLTGELGFLLTQMESSSCFIMNIDYEHLKITKEEFDKNFSEAEEKFNQNNI